MREPKAMREIHKIREQIYEEIKDMTPEEMSAYFQAAQDKVAKEWGIKFSDRKPAKRYADTN